MSFLKRLFGLGSDKSGEVKPAAEAATMEHKGFIIVATPFSEAGQYQTCGLIRKEINGELKEQKFIRADRFASMDDAVNISFAKGRQIVDEQGEGLFS